MTPSDIFKEAQDALARGDWDTFYACLDRRDVLTLARNSMNINFSFHLVDDAVRSDCNSFSLVLSAVEAAHAEGD